MTKLDTGEVMIIPPENIYDHVTDNRIPPHEEGSEQVLVFPSCVANFKNCFDGGPLVTDHNIIKEYLEEVLRLENLAYIDRDVAENDPDFLQVIPYTVIWRGREVFRYSRTKKSGEARLHEKHSIGVGGHINPADGIGEEACWAACYRELSEEVSLKVPSVAALPIRVVGLIYDTSTDVGKVHFGIVHFLTVPFDVGMDFHDPALAGGHFEHAVHLKQSTDDFESWSRFVIDKLI